ncbi:hypothetical protein D3C80_1996360 [compost metagenome]
MFRSEKMTDRFLQLGIDIRKNRLQLLIQNGDLLGLGIEAGGQQLIFLFDLFEVINQ